MRRMRGQVGRSVADRPRPRHAGGIDPSLLVGLAPFDDAAIYEVAPDVALVSTTDFFPPLVDHPSDFGAIAAANACSDVFAMGGRVAIAVNVAAFPEHFPREAIVAIFDAAAAVVAEAGGTDRRRAHDPQPRADLRARRAGRRPPGEGLPQGWRPARRRAGALQAARHRSGARRRIGRPTRPRRSPACAGLNRAASEELQSLGAAVHAVTDVTGYGLAGHGWEMAERGGVQVVIDTDGHRARIAARWRLPSAVFAPAAIRATATTSPVTCTRRPALPARRCAWIRRPPAGCWPPSIRRRCRRCQTCGGGSATVAAGDTAHRVALMAVAAAPTRSIEKELWAAGHEVIVGIDEVGRGAWAGPLMVGAAVLPRERRVNGVRDSKMLTEAGREFLFDRIVRWCDAWAVGGASQEECDELGMAEAQRLATRRAIAGLGVEPDAAVVDGKWNFVGTGVAHVEMR